MEACKGLHEENMYLEAAYLIEDYLNTFEIPRGCGKTVGLVDMLYRDLRKKEMFKELINIPWMVYNINP